MKWLPFGIALLISGLPAAAASLQPPTEKLLLSPAYPEIPPTFWEQYGWWTILGSLVALGLIALVLWLKLRSKPAVTVPIQIQTRQELEALRQQPEDGKTLSRISRCLRRYVAIAFQLPPHEMTTAELSRLLAASPAVGSNLSVSLSDFFRRCDEWKFSPAPSPAPGAAGRALELLEAGERRRVELAAKPPVIA
ncbi:MAG: DUF4381 domain-containing protein [Akkermansiaceae bacterium]|nr:DUF4381 domain-containing protein [Verrucomicrobiales bacterium]